MSPARIPSSRTVAKRTREPGASPAAHLVRAHRCRPMTAIARRMFEARRSNLWATHAFNQVGQGRHQGHGSNLWCRPLHPRGLRAGRHVGLLMGPALFTGTHRCIDPRAHIFLTATQRRRHVHASGCPRPCPLLATPSRPRSPETSGYVYVYVLRVLVCLVTARGLLYLSKPSIEVTNVNAGAPECKAGQPGPSGRRRAHLTVRLLSAPIPALPPPRGIQVSGRNAVQLRSCGGRIRRFVGRLAHRRSLRPPRAKCGVRPQTNRGCRPRKRPANCQLR